MDKMLNEGLHVLANFYWWIAKILLPGVPVSWVLAWIASLIWPTWETVFEVPILLTFLAVMLLVKAVYCKTVHTWIERYLNR